MANKIDEQVAAAAASYVRSVSIGMQTFVPPLASHTIGTFGTEGSRAYLGELDQTAGFHLDDVASLAGKSSAVNSRPAVNINHSGALQIAGLNKVQQPPDFTAPSVNSVESRHHSSHRGAAQSGGFVSTSGNRIDTWEDSLMADTSPRTDDTSTDVDTDEKVNQKMDLVRHGGDSSDRTKDKNGDQKTLRRLAQNREAARKSRLRKKAYVQQLESSRLKLTQLEQELQRARQQGIFIGGSVGDQSHSMSGNGALAFDMEYARWLDEHHRQINDLRSAVNSHVGDNELRGLVEGVMAHYEEIFRLKSVAAKSDVFHLVSGMWKTPAERCFMWMGGFRPSELLKILVTHLEPLTEHQFMGINNLQHSSQQAEDALSQGMDALQQSLAETLASGSLGPPGTSGNVANYMGQMAMAMGKLGTLEGFVHQADNLRQQTLQQMHRILTTRQAARALLAISDYFSRLRALSSLWLARPKE